MAKEIERKFLVKGDEWRRSASAGTRLRQGYLSDGGNAAVRVRIAEDRAFITVKAARPGRVRDEFEYPIPVTDAEQMLALCTGAILEKTRFRIPEGRYVWEVDVYAGDNAGLVLAEIELDGEEATFGKPSWLGPEVTDAQQFYASKLSRRSFKEWSAAERAEWLR